MVTFLDPPTVTWVSPTGGGFTVPAGGTIKSASQASSALDSTSAVSFNAGFNGHYLVKPGSTISTSVTLPSVGTAAANIGWRDSFWYRADTQPDGNPTQLDYQIMFGGGTWTAHYSLVLSSGLGLGLTAGVVYIIYAVNPSNVSRELVRFTSSLNGVSAIRSDTSFSPTSSNFTLNAGEILQYEVYIRINNTGTGNGAGTIQFPVGAAGLPTVTSGYLIPPNPPVALFPEGVTESVTISSLNDRTYLSMRNQPENTSISDINARRIFISRSNLESGIATDNLGRVYIAVRAGNETTFLTDTAVRLLLAYRNQGESALGVDSISRLLTMGRSIVQVNSVTDILLRTVIYQRLESEYPPGTAPDYTGSFPGGLISGTVRDSKTGLPVAGANVRLFRQQDNKFIGSTTSDSNGLYSFARDKNDPYTYFVVAVLAGTPEIHGVSDADLPVV